MDKLNTICECTIFKRLKIILSIQLIPILVLLLSAPVRAEDTLPKTYHATTQSNQAHSIDDGINLYFQALQNHSTTLTFSFDSNFDYRKFWDQLRMILDSHTRTYSDFNVNMLNIDVRNDTATITIDYFTSIEEEQRLDLFDSQLRAQMTGMSDFEKIRFVHDYLCQNVIYDDETLYNLANERSAYCAFVKGKTVCSGYALAFQRIMEEEGIPSKIMCGHTPQGPHAWNVVYLDGNWYHIDATWDDQDWGIDRSSFLVGLDKIPFAYQYNDMNFQLSPTSYSY